jgi:hypothetical protein
MSKTTITQHILVPNTEARKDVYKAKNETNKMRWITIEIVGTYEYDGGSYWEPGHEEYCIEKVYEVIRGQRVELPEEDDEWLEYWLEDIDEKAQEEYFKNQRGY